MIFIRLVAFTKTVKNRGQEYLLELVDTAGQVLLKRYCTVLYCTGEILAFQLTSFPACRDTI